MRPRNSILLLLLATLIGCGRDEPAAAPASQPATRSAATQPVKVEPAKLTIDGQPFAFAPAVLTMQGEAPRLTGMFYTAAETSESHNAFYFDLAFDLDEGAPISQATCRYRTDNRDRTDSAAGIFLPTEKVTLQALELSVDLEEPAGGAVVVKLDGQFLVFPDDADVATRIVKVSGKFRCALVGLVSPQ